MPFGLCRAHWTLKLQTAISCSFECQAVTRGLREKTAEEKAGGAAPGVPAGFTSPTLILPSTTSSGDVAAPAPAAAAPAEGEEEDTKVKGEQATGVEV